jgi:hypothetical protein
VWLWDALEERRRFSEVAARVQAYLGAAGHHYEDAAGAFPPETAEMPAESYERLWPQMEEALPGLRLTEHYLSRDDPANWHFEMYGGRSDRTGLKVWLRDHSQVDAPIDRMVMIVWVLPGSRSADRFLTYAQTMLSERLEQLLEWRENGNGRHALFGGRPPVVLAPDVPFTHFLSLSRRANVIVKTYMASFEAETRLTSELAQEVASIVDRHVDGVLEP